MFNKNENRYESYLNSCSFNVTKLIAALRRTAHARGADIVGTTYNGAPEKKPVSHRAYLRQGDSICYDCFIDWLDEYDHSTGLSYCSFIYNDYLYYIQISESDFYTIRYTKEAPDQHFRKYIDELKTRAAWAVRFGEPLSDVEAETAAAYLFNDLVEAPVSATVTKKVRKYYSGNKYYYENEKVINDSPFKKIADMNNFI